MSLTKAFPDSNALSGGGQRPEDNANGSDVASLGYKVVSFPSQKPAQSNAEVGITADFSFSEVNEGTSVKSYSIQPATVSSESGS